MAEASATGRPALPPLEGTARIVGTVALSLAMFMNSLDITIANVSIPAISGDLGASPSQGSWVITSYGVANAISVIMVGWLAQRIGQVRLIVGATFLFSLSSLLCALAPNLQLLILFRLIQGLTAGPIIVLSQPLLIQSHPPSRIAMVLSLYVMSTMIGPVLGPVVGGMLTDGLSWHWIFYINVPLGLLAAWLICHVYRTRESPLSRAPMDFVGLVLLLACIGPMQLMMEKGRELDWFASDEIVLLGVCALVSGAFFVAWNAGARHPLVDFTALRQRNFVTCAIIMSVGAGIFVGTSVITSIWLQQHVGYTATWAGTSMVPGSILTVLLMPLVGHAIQRIEIRLAAVVALLTLVVAFYIRSCIASNADFFTITLYQLTQGIGMALFFVPFMTMALKGIAPEKLAGASGLMAFSRYVGSSSGTSLLITLWERRADQHALLLSEQINPANQNLEAWLAQLEGMGFDPMMALRLAQQKIGVEASTLGGNDVYLLCAGLFGSMIGLVLLSHGQARTSRPRMLIE